MTIREGAGRLSGSLNGIMALLVVGMFTLTGATCSWFQHNQNTIKDAAHSTLSGAAALTLQVATDCKMSVPPSICKSNKAHFKSYCIAQPTANDPISLPAGAAAILAAEKGDAAALTAAVLTYVGDVIGFNSASASMASPQRGTLNAVLAPNQKTLTAADVQAIIGAIQLAVEFITNLYEQFIVQDDTSLVQSISTNCSAIEAL